MSRHLKSLLVPTKRKRDPTPNKMTRMLLPALKIPHPKDIDSNVWKAPPKIQVNVEDLLQWVKAISSDVQEHELMFNLKEAKNDQKKRTVSVFVVDKRLRKIVKIHKDMVVRQLTSQGVKVLAVITGTFYDFWDVLLLTAEVAIALPRKILENKDYIFRTEYMGRWRTTVSVYKIPSFLRDANLVDFMLKFDDIVSASHDGMRGEWRFDIMLDVKTFYSIPNWFGFGRVQGAGYRFRLQTSLLALR